MTANPNYPNYPGPPNVPYAAAQPGRPTSVTVLAILGIIFGALATFCMPFVLIPYLTNIGTPNPAIDAVKNSPALMTWMILATIVGWILGVVEFTCSIGALQLKRWARTGLLAYAWAAIVFGLVGFALNITWVIPKMYAGQRGQAQAMGGMVGSVCGGFIGLIVPVLILLFFNREHVKEAFEGGRDPSAGSGYPPQYP
jgi:hypothetical protein